MRKKNIIGINIRQARKKSHVTQMDLAAQLQLLGLRIDRSAVAKIEVGIRPISDIEIIAIARVLNIPVPSIFEESDEMMNLFLD